MERLLVDLAFAAAWPAAESEEVGGWLLRATGGVTRRANSALALCRPPDLGRALARVESWYGERGLVPRVQLGAEATRLGLVEAIGDRGWVLGDGACDILVRPLAGIEQTAPDVHVEAAETPTDEWLDTWWAVSPRAGENAREHASGVLARIGAPSRFLLGRTEDGAAAACALGVVAEGLLVVESVATLPDRRRRGAATALVSDLLGWGGTQGARNVVLAVEKANADAGAFWAGLAFAAMAGWTYATPPS